MLKKLRAKFIALNMATAAMVLIVVFTAICVINYQQDVQDVYSALDAAVSHAGDSNLRKQQDEASGESAGGLDAGTGTSVDGTNAQDDGTGAPADGTASQIDGAAADGAAAQSGESTTVPSGDAQQDALSTFTPPEIGGKQGGTKISVPTAVYKLADGTLSALPSMNTATIATDVLAKAAAELTEIPEGTGQLEALGLYYEKRSVEGATYIAFADVSAASSWQGLALVLAGVGVAALAVFFVISLFFSRWALRPVARAWDAQRRFVADASHDLKTPLTVILANTSILLEHPERSIASQSRWVESTQNEAEQMQGLVGDLLLLAQLDEEEGSAAPAHDALGLSDLVEGELLEFESLAYERNVQLETQVEGGITVAGNATRLRRLVTTLVDNACKYVDAGGQVDVSLQARGGEAVLTVHNTGAAITPEDLPHVFDRFYRADKARTRDDSGHGLGLAIAHAIAEEHGGTLSAVSTESAGTTFTATLPLA